MPESATSTVRVDPSVKPAGCLLGGRYRIEAELGRGGMGAAYRALDEATGRVVALKTLTATSTAARALFEREFATLASLSHPCVIEVYDFVVTKEGERFYTMELLEGEDLAVLAPVPWRKLCSYVRDAAMSLALVHARRLVHRDVSPRNVRITPGGRAKLLDFGALSEFGRAEALVGTPTCIAPETLRGESLDQRTDLFSLGVTAYLGLTKRRPYAVPDFDRAEAAWARSPDPPSDLVPDVPKGLDQLLLSMLAPDPAGRPSSAAEVIDRLTAMAELDDEPLAGVVESHVSGSALVGRDREQLQLRQHLDKARTGEGHVVILEGALGMGGSRLSRELSIDARLSGMAAVRVSALALGGPGAVLRALVSAVFDAAPAEAEEAARADPDLQRTLDEMRGRARPSRMGRRRMLSSTGLEQHAHDQLLVVDWLLDVAKRRPLLVVVDDGHAVDAGSAGALAVIGHAARRTPLLLLVTLLAGADLPVATQQIARIAARIKLRGLERRHLDELFRSVFGDVPHLARVTEWAFTVAAGNPGQSLELLRYLVERKIIRYASGAWVLPADLSDQALPASVEEAIASRLSDLGPRARDLARYLALHRGALSTTVARKLLPHLEKAELDAAAEELKTRQIATGMDETLRLAQEALRELLVAPLTEDEKRRRHAALGRALVGNVTGTDRKRLRECSADQLGGALQAGWHLLHGGEEEAGRELLRGAGIELTYRGDGLADAVPAVEAALEAYRAQGRSRYECGYLLILLNLAGTYWDPRLMYRHSEELFETLAEVTGMTRARRLTRWLGPHLALWLSMAVAFVLMIFTSRRRITRGFEEAFLALIGHTTAALGACAVVLDGELAARILLHLSPLRYFPRGHAVRLMVDFQSALAATVGHRYAAGLATGREVLTRLRRPGGVPGIPEDIRAQIEVGVHLLVGSTQALADGSGVEETLDALTRLPGALSRQADATIRVDYHCYRGERALVEKYREVLDVLGAQTGSTWRNDVLLYRNVWWHCAMCQDILGLKRAASQLDALADTHPSLASDRDLANASYLAERGMSEQALSRYGDFLEQGAAGDTSVAAIHAGVHARILRALGQPGRAREVCEATLGRLRPEDLALIGFTEVARIELALSMADLGDTAAAIARLDSLAAEPHENPLLQGLVRRARAEIALARRDRAAFRESLAAMQVWFQRADNPALMGQCQRIAEQGRALDMLGAATLRLPGAPREEKDSLSVEQAFLGCRGAEERFQAALDLVVGKSGAAHGYLYLLEPGGLRFAAPAVGAEPTALLFEEVVRVVEAAKKDTLETEVVDDVEPGTLITVVESGDDPELRRARAGSPFRSLLLTVSRGDEEIIVGAVALVEGPRPLDAVSYSFLEEVARGIYESGDLETAHRAARPSASPQAQ